MPTTLTRLFCFFALAFAAFGQQPSDTAVKAGGARRLYVEPFTTKEGAEKLRDDVIAELRRLGGL